MKGASMLANVASFVIPLAALVIVTLFGLKLRAALRKVPATRKKSAEPAETTPPHTHATI